MWDLWPSRWTRKGVIQALENDPAFNPRHKGQMVSHGSRRKSSGNVIRPSDGTVDLLIKAWKMKWTEISKFSFQKTIKIADFIGK